MTLQGEWVNDSFVKVFGFNKEEIDARGGWTSMVYKEDLQIAQEHAHKVASGTTDICELRFITRDGKIRWLRDYATPVYNEKEKRVTQIYGASQDITEQKEMEQALREREERLSRLAETTATAIFIY